MPTQNSTTIRFNTFGSARDKVPNEHDLSWAQLVEQLRRLVKTTSGKRPPRDAAEADELKRKLPAFTCAQLREPYNTNANVEHLTALPIDVDACDGAALIEAIDAHNMSAVVYASPSDPNPDGSRRLRVVVELSEPLAPEHVEQARFALAELLGIAPGQGVETAKAISQVMFVGKIAGTPDRDFDVFEGAPVDTAALVSARLAHAWQKPRAEANAVKALERVGIEDADERTTALLEALEPHWVELTEHREALRALGGYLARRGWTDEQIAAVARGLAPDRPVTNRVNLAVECARDTRASNGEIGAGWSTLVAKLGDAAALIESVAKSDRA